MRYFLSLFILVYGLLLNTGVNICKAQSMKERFHKLMFSSHQHGKTGNLQGHSHNDYKQDIPFSRAYHAGMKSIEADVFLQGDSLYVAHEPSEIHAGRTLEVLYLDPLLALFTESVEKGGRSNDLQLVIDIKENHTQVLGRLVKILKSYQPILAKTDTSEGVHIVISGDMPKPEEFSRYPSFISFDGRPDIDYTQAELARIAMISAGLSDYVDWNGKGRIQVDKREVLSKMVQHAAGKGKPFRFWGTPDSKNAWIELEKLGVTWINTDQPVSLGEWLDELPFTRVRLDDSLAVYQPEFPQQGWYGVKPKNIILLIGDGMGLAHVKAAMSANRGNLSMTKLRHIGFSRTESADAGNTDSGAGGSALATGFPAKNGSIGVDADGRERPSVSDLLAENLGMDIALISTGDLTDATPAAFYASHVDRNASKSIAQQLLSSSVSFIAGAMPGFLEDSLQREKFAVHAREKHWKLGWGMDTISFSKEHPQALMFGSDCFKPVYKGRGPIFKNLVHQVLSYYNRTDKPFFLMAEGAQIDYGGHARDLNYVVTETLDFDQAVGEALRFADQDKETLVIITADHETGALSLLDVDENNGYIVGDFASNDHSNIMVPVFAYGPSSERFSGVFKNTELLEWIREWARSSAEN